MCSWSGSAAFTWVQRAATDPVRVVQGAGLDMMAPPGVKATQGSEECLGHLDVRADGVVVARKEYKGHMGVKGGQVKLVLKAHLEKMVWMEHPECKGSVDRAGIGVGQARQARLVGKECKEEWVREGHRVREECLGREERKAREVREERPASEEKGVREEGMVSEAKEARWGHQEREARLAGLAITVTHGLGVQGTTT